jgi:tetratricopeptide (TPR) repeat protein
VTPHAVELPHDIRESSGPTALDSALTRAGAFLGTPLYMSPEQLAGENADARSDQFSFCVAAYHALFGERPFTASSIEELRTVITKNRVNEPPKASRVPLHLRQALMRGLDAAPARRWPSMDALLFELEREPGAQLRRRLVAAVALGAVVVAGISWQAVRRHAHEACVQAGGDITRHWNDARKAKVHEAFTAANVPFAEHAWSTIERRLDGYASAWSAMRSEACEAATVDATQTEEQLRLRVACLDQREQELSALVDVLATADVKVVQGSVEAAHALTSISGCADLVALRAVRPPPSQPEAKAKIEAARAQLAVVKSLSDSGSLAAALDKARAATKLAHEIGYAPLISEAQLRQGDLEAKTGDRKSAEVTLQQAVRFAQVANADELAARAWNVLGFVIGFELGRHPEGEAFCRYAEAVIERQGGNPELTADNLRSMGLVLEHEGKFDEALKLLKDSLAVREKLTGAEHPAVATASSSVGNAYIMKAQFAEARPYQERALAIRLKLLGPQHPDTSKSYHNLAICLSHLGERARAVEYLEKALDVDSAVFGPHSDSTAQTRMTLGKAWFADHHPQQAREAAQIALEDLTQAFGADAPATSPTVLLLARIALAEGQLPEALGYFQRGLAIRAKQMGNNHEVLADYLTGIGECQLALHQPRLALASFERAGHLDNAARSSPEDRAKMNWGLARSIWESRGAKGEAIDRAVEAKTLYANTLDHSEDVQRLDGWLETHKL